MAHNEEKTHRKHKAKPAETHKPANYPVVIQTPETEEGCCCCPDCENDEGNVASPCEDCPIMAAYEEEDKTKNDDVDLANLRERILWLEGEVDPIATTYITKYIMRFNLDDKGKPVEERVPIKICINTQGGESDTMWTLIQTIKMSKTPVYTIGISRAESAGAHILSAGSKRYVMPSCTVMVHSGSIQLAGTAEQVESATTYYKKQSLVIKKRFVEDTRIDMKTFESRGAGDWYLDAAEAVKYGIVDEIITDLDDVF